MQTSGWNVWFVDRDLGKGAVSTLLGSSEEGSRVGAVSGSVQVSYPQPQGR